MMFPFILPQKVPLHRSKQSVQGFSFFIGFSFLSTPLSLWLETVNIHALVKDERQKRFIHLLNPPEIIRVSGFQFSIGAFSFFVWAFEYFDDPPDFE